MIVALCLAVAYTSRVSTLPNQAAAWSGQPAIFQPSAFANPDGAATDLLVRPAVSGSFEATPQRLQVMRYVVQAGDTVSSLADRFDVSENTILWANNLAPGEALTPGQQLTILPVSGVLYTTRAGDTITAIAQKFESDAAAITQYNQLTAGSPVNPGLQLIIPGGRLDTSSRPDLSARSLTRPTGSDSSRPTSPPPAPNVTAANVPGSAGGATGTIDRIPFRNRASGPTALAPLTYYVVPGDTLSGIAQRFGVSPESIAAASGLTSQDALSVNQKLLIPPVPGTLHVVQDGDTLQGIADRYSADPDQIARANGLKEPFLLQIGQTLVIPGGKVPEVVPTPAPSAAASQTTYTVAEGDSVSSIATSFGVDMRAIIDANGLTEPYLLQPGQQIVVPGANQQVVHTTAPAAPSRSHTTYTVQQGDSLSQIAASFGVDLSALVSANNIGDPSSLQPGQQLIIPGAVREVVRSIPAAPPARPAPAPTPAPAPRPVVAKPAPPPPPAPSSGSSGWNIVAIASRYLGAPYAWGGTSPSGFDCSGFVWYAYRRAGISIPRDMWGQYQSGTHVSRSNLQPGDIVFFAGTYASGLSHDGIYIGGGRFINAVDYGIGVAVRSLADPYWSSRYFGATRPW